MKTIFFNSKSKTHSFLSNFFPAQITIDDLTYPTVEHYFQAMKFPTDPEYQELIRLTKTPSSAKRMGASRSHPITPQWDQIKTRVMVIAITAKFTQHPDLQQRLTDTAPSILVERSYRDTFWGVTQGGIGHNVMGVLLMKLRDATEPTQVRL